MKKIIPYADKNSMNDWVRLYRHFFFHSKLPTNLCFKSVWSQPIPCKGNPNHFLPPPRFLKHSRNLGLWKWWHFVFLVRKFNTCCSCKFFLLTSHIILFVASSRVIWSEETVLTEFIHREITEKRKGNKKVIREGVETLSDVEKCFYDTSSSPLVKPPRVLTCWLCSRNGMLKLIPDILSTGGTQDDDLRCFKSPPQGMSCETSTYSF